MIRYYESVSGAISDRINPFEELGLRCCGSLFCDNLQSKKEHFFGAVCGGTMTLNTIGSTVQNEWLQTPILRPDMNITLGEFVVMPNHFHAIIMIGENEYNKAQSRDGLMPVSPADGQKVHKNLPSIIRGFKAAVTTKARNIRSDFGWQDRFHDRVIRSQDEHTLIANYIVNNPVNWENDRFY